MHVIRHGLPLLIFILVIGFLWRGLGLKPDRIPSPLINHPAPTFSLPTLSDINILTSNKDLFGHVTLVNVWATWCYACALEHDFLMELKDNSDFVIYGLNYKDDRIAAQKWLETNGNPYQIIATDINGNVGIDWGVYGTPETFILDKKGIIRYKHIGQLTPEIWETTLRPMIDKLQVETS